MKRVIITSLSIVIFLFGSLFLLNSLYARPQRIPYINKQRVTDTYKQSYLEDLQALEDAITEIPNITTEELKSGLLELIDIVKKR